MSGHAVSRAGGDFIFRRVENLLMDHFNDLE